jgi:hypothetical protein
MKACSRAVLIGLAFVALSGPTAAGNLKLEIRNGLVTLEARDVPVRDILAEWARVGRTRIENREQVGGGPVTLTLKDVPERDALEILLRSVTGYIAAPRPTPVSDASIFDVVYVMATTRPSSALGSAASPLSQSQQQLMRGGRGQMPGIGSGLRPNQPPDDATDDAMPPVMRPGYTVDQMQYPGAMGAQIQLSPGMLTAPAQSGQGAQPMPYSSLPGESTAPGAAVPTGSTSTPGLVAPTTPGTVPKPIKPPGGPGGKP